MKKIVVIPTYNEKENIRRMLDTLRSLMADLHILVVDDNSPDGTASIIKEMMQQDSLIHILERPGKNGLGTAYCAGFAQCLEQGYDIICQMDCDFSHNPNDLMRLIAELETNDVAIGSRYVTGVNVVNWPMGRLLLSWFANKYTQVITGMPIHDATGGFKAFKADVLRKIDLTRIHSSGYAFQIEMNFKAWYNKARIKELSIVFVDRVEGVSKMSKNIVFEAATLVWKLKIQSLFGWIR